MTTIYIVSDNGDLDQGFVKFLAAHASDAIGAGAEVEVKIVPHRTWASAEHQEFVNETWDLWCSLPKADRAEWAA
jgi:hypothetical protein